MIFNKHTKNISLINLPNTKKTSSVFMETENDNFRISFRNCCKFFVIFIFMTLLTFSTVSYNSLITNAENLNNDKSYLIALNENQNAPIKTPTAEETRNGNFLSYMFTPVVEDDNYIYYLDKGASDAENPTLFRMQKDGTNPEQISHTVICNNLSLDGKYLYYSGNGPMGNGLMRKDLDTLKEEYINMTITVTNDGEENHIRAQAKEGSVDMLMEKDGWIYYLKKNPHASDYSFYKVKTDDTENTPLKDHVEKFTVAEDRIFYTTKYGSSLYSMDLNGNDDKTILKDKVFNYYILGDNIYYQTINYFTEGRNKSSSYAIKKANLDGSNDVLVFNNSDYILSGVSIYGEWLYFSTLRMPMDSTAKETSDGTYDVKPEYGFYRIKINSENVKDIKNAELISSDSVVKYMFINNQLWYTGYNYEMCKIDLKP